MSSNILRSRQLNPCDHYFWKCRGYTERPHNWKDLLENMGYYDESDSESEDDYEETARVKQDNNILRSRQMNPCDHLFWKCRGYTERPHNWKDLLENMGYYDESDSESEDDYEETARVKQDNNILRSRQMNPCDHLFWKCRGYTERPHNWKDLLENMGYYDESDSESEDDYEETARVKQDNNILRSRQMNPCDHLFWKCRGYTERPHNWKDLLENMGYYDESDSESEDDYEETARVKQDNNILRSRQMNPCDHLFWKCRGYTERPHNWKDLLENMGYYDESDSESEDDYEETARVKQDNNILRSRQMNPCDHLFWKCRGYTERPHNWKDLLENMGYYDESDSESEDDYEETARVKQDNNILRSRQMNPCDHLFWKCRGYTSRPSNWKDLLEDMGYYDEDSSESEDDYKETASVSQNNNTLRSRELNPCDHLFWKCRGYTERPHNWEDLLYDVGYYDENDSEWEDEETTSVSQDDDTYSSYGESSNSKYSASSQSNAENPNHDDFWRARGWPRRPNDWQQRYNAYCRDK